MLIIIGGISILILAFSVVIMVMSIWVKSLKFGCYGLIFMLLSFYVTSQILPIQHAITYSEMILENAVSDDLVIKENVNEAQSQLYIWALMALVILFFQVLLILSAKRRKRKLPDGYS
ncbi:hypothetical protein [Fulvivirga ligni]|uniref:hypothetical protein n=1 Tax=Fulvivirga ligni TaxID=2904246 RepID=UPI001F210332|nr:hypothetical protein [Fulvivirga ligni]UII24260.1 hypothetical protein LVD16_13645 [Fulvivirga ligni]